MKHFLAMIILFCLVLSSSAFAGIYEIKTNEDGTQRIEEVIIPAVEPSKHPLDPSFLRNLRTEIQKVMIEEQKKAQEDGVFKHTNKRFIPESMTFFIAGGWVYFNTLLIKTNGDPEMMIKHIESLKDPIAHVSFYAFMQANGFYIDFRTQKLDPFTKQLMMRRLNYQGMAVGSLASSVTADVLSTFKSCANGWFENKNTPESQAACDEALKSWTARDKFTQYGPQILSLFASQYGAETAEGAGRFAFRALNGGESLAKIEASAIKFFKISEAAVEMVITPGGPVVRSFVWLGKITKFSMFLAIDHLVTPSVMRFGNNIVQPFFFQFDVAKLDRLMQSGSDVGWSSAIAKNARLANCPVQIPFCKSFDELPKEISNYTHRMKQWRMHLNGKVENDIAAWLDITMRLLNQIAYTRQFYLSFLENLFDTKNRTVMVEQGVFKDEPERAWATQRQYPDRILPLYGVTPGPRDTKEKDSELYLSKPYLIEESQSKRLNEIAQSGFTTIDKTGLDPIHMKKLANLLMQLLSKDVKTQGEALNEINNQLGIYNKTLTQQRLSLSPVYVQILNQLRKTIGTPWPLVTKGAAFAHVFNGTPANKLIGENAKFQISTRRLNFNKPSDLLMYLMVCGAEKAEMTEGMFEGFWFHAPKITKTNQEPAICSTANYITSENLYRLPIDVNQTITDYIAKNVDPNILGDVTDSKKKNAGFQAFWEAKVVPVTQTSLQSFDKRYQTLVEQTYKNIFNQRSAVDYGLDTFSHFSSRMPLSIFESLNFELEFYIRSLQTVIGGTKVTSTSFTDDTITAAKKDSAVDAHFNMEDFGRRHASTLNYFKVRATDLKTTEDFKEKLFKPAADLIKESLQKNYNERVTENQKKMIRDMLNDYALFQILQIRKNYKEMLSLLQEPESAISFKRIEEIEEKITKSLDSTIAIPEGMQMLASLLPAEVQTLMAIKSGLQSLDLDIKRYVFMRVQLQNRLEIDMAKLNSFMKGTKTKETHTGTKMGSSD